MRLTKKRAADLVLGVQILVGAYACAVQVERLTRDTRGVSLAQYVCSLAYVLICFAIFRRANRAKPGRVTRNTMLLFAGMAVPYVLYIVTLLVGDHYRWTTNDTLAIAAALGGSLLAFFIGVGTHRSLHNATVDAGIAISCRALPQFLQAYKVLQEGNQGIVGFIIATSNLAIAARLGQVVWAWRESPKEYNRRAALVAEAVSALASLAVEAAWLARR